jgi:hypothetical protein
LLLSAFTSSLRAAIAEKNHFPACLSFSLGIRHAK